MILILIQRFFIKPSIKGTRISVCLIIEMLSLGETIEDLLAACPMLNEKKTYACLAFATALLRNEESY